MTEAQTVRLLIPKIIPLPLAAGTHPKHSGFNPNRRDVGSYPHPSTTPPHRHSNIPDTSSTLLLTWHLLVMLSRTEGAERKCQTPDDIPLHSALTVVVLQHPRPPTLDEVTRGKQLSFFHWGGCIKAVGGELVSNASQQRGASEEQLLFSFTFQLERQSTTVTPLELTPTEDLLPPHVQFSVLLSFPDTDWESSPSREWKWGSFCKISRQIIGAEHPEGWRVDSAEAWWESIFSQTGLPYKYVNELWVMYSASSPPCMQMLLNVTSQMLPNQTGDHAFNQSVHRCLTEQHWYATINITPVHTSKSFTRLQNAGIKLLRLDGKILGVIH